MKNTDIIQMEQHRGDCYRLFAALFYPPDKESFLDEDVCGNLVQLLESVCPMASDHASGMAKVLERADAQALSIAHAKLFLGPFELQAPPYGSVYLDENTRLMGDSTVAVMKMYQLAGLSLSDENREAPDHIAIELEFMYYLISREIQSFKSGDTDEALEYLRMQHKFNDKYLATWIGPFCDKIRESSEDDSYKLLSMCLSIFIQNTVIPATLPSRAEVSG